jgi:hypothetical protein
MALAVNGWGQFPFLTIRSWRVVDAGPVYWLPKMGGCLAEMVLGVRDACHVNNGNDSGRCALLGNLPKHYVRSSREYLAQ